MSISVTNQQSILEQASGYSSGGGTSTQATRASSQLGQSDFLELLTVQLQNQDPMSPMSDMDFISSMSSFSSVDAISSLSTNFESFMQNQGELSASTLVALNALVENLGANQDMQAQMAAQAYLGKEVTISDPDKGEFTGTVDRIELIQKENIDGTSEQMVGLVVNDEIFPVDLVTGIADPGGIVSGLSNVVSSAIQVATGIL